MTKKQSSPFIFEVGSLLRSGSSTAVVHTGPSPVRIGPAMIAIPEGADVTVDAQLSSLGDAVMVNAEIRAHLAGECVRCLSPLTPEYSLQLTQVFAASEDFISGEEAEDEDESVPMVVDDHIDLLQTVIDEAVLDLPFNPTCDEDCGEDVPEVEEGIEEEETMTVDPRWAGLEKFL